MHFGDGKQRKSTHIDDCVKALFHICEGPYSENKARYHVFHLDTPAIVKWKIRHADM